MKISVVIPTYNSAAVIRHTLDSVLKQTVRPDEILILDDGSKDETISILKSYEPQVTVLQQQNRGVAAARNVLSRRAGGDLVAFLDHDDLWHPRYLQVQSAAFAKHPTATAFFTRHNNLNGHGGYEWSSATPDLGITPEVIGPADFLRRYNSSTGTFYSMSFCCIPKSLLSRLGDAPFCEAVTGVDDCYICNLLPLHGNVVFTPAPLVAYRVTNSAQSVNQLKNFKLVVDVFERLDGHYREPGNAKLLDAFNCAFAGKERRYGKTLMGAGQVSEARIQFRAAAGKASDLGSRVKSLGLYFATFLPGTFQPRWPASQRQSPLPQS